MKTTRLVALAAVLCAGVTLPASAAWDRIGSVQFSPRNDHETTYGNFGGRVEALSLGARNAPVACNNVTATFGNGMTRTVFRGMLTPGRDVTVDLPAGSVAISSSATHLSIDDNSGYEKVIIKAGENLT